MDEICKGHGGPQKSPTVAVGHDNRSGGLHYLLTCFARCLAWQINRGSDLTETKDGPLEFIMVFRELYPLIGGHRLFE